MSYENIDDGRKVRVRKDCNCEWCGESIKKGEIAIKRTYKFEGGFNDARQHPECYEAMQQDDESCDYGFEPYGMERPLPQPPKNQDKE